MKQNNSTSNQANKSKRRDATDSLKNSGEQQKWWKPDSAQQRVLDEGKIETNFQTLMCQFLETAYKWWGLKQSVEGILVGVFINLAPRLGYTSYFGIPIPHGEGGHIYKVEGRAHVKKQFQLRTPTS